MLRLSRGNAIVRGRVAELPNRVITKRDRYWTGLHYAVSGDGISSSSLSDLETVISDYQSRGKRCSVHATHLPAQLVQ